jgi:hypothetical protein
MFRLTAGTYRFRSAIGVVRWTAVQDLAGREFDEHGVSPLIRGWYSLEGKFTEFRIAGTYAMQGIGMV